MSSQPTWAQFCSAYHVIEETAMALDCARFDPGDYPARMAEPMRAAFDEMARLESGAVANPDEHRMVGHYWLRNPDLAPDPAIADAIRTTRDRVVQLADDIRTGRLAAPDGGRFEQLFVAGIGGSALGPQLLLDALVDPEESIKAFFFDNTDPDGYDRILAAASKPPARTLTLVISKSGTTPETRNAMREIQHAYARCDVAFARCAVAITGEGSALHQQSRDEGWLAALPMWDWVGGRTSVTSAVGLLPAALCGVDVNALLDGARRMDAVTRRPHVEDNPAALLALIWHLSAKQHGRADMVVIPYRDRLSLFARYLQQLVMESLGKGCHRNGQQAAEGLTVYGNKGSTDQHAYVQQLREGMHNFFAVFVDVLADQRSHTVEVEPGATSDDYLSGFLLGTRAALFENARQSVTITLDAINAESMGALIALFERTVGLYASMVDINAYHQPGVEAGKKAAGKVIALQPKVLEVLRSHRSDPMSADAIARAVGDETAAECVFKMCDRWSCRRRAGVHRVGARHPAKARFVID